MIYRALISGSLIELPTAKLRPGRTYVWKLTAPGHAPLTGTFRVAR